MVKRFKRMPDSDINTIVADLDCWALGELGSKLTQAVLEECFGFSRKSLQAKPEIKAAYNNANRALSDGLVKTKAQATKEVKELQVEVGRLKNELEAYRRKEEQQLHHWQKIAFHVRQKGIPVVNVDKVPLEGVICPRILKSHRFSGCLIRKFHLLGERSSDYR